MKKIYTAMLLVLCIVFSSAQYRDFLNPTDTSESSVRKHHKLISSNPEIVAYIEHTMDEYGVPRHLRNLALIESHFKSGAVSVVGASGVWQFMIPHAGEYGLSPHERADIYKSTKIAARSLRNLYKKHGNWITVVAAYNCGSGNVNKAIRRAGSKDYGSFYPFLPQESINHVKKYLNAAYATGELQEVQQDYARFAGYPTKKDKVEVPSTSTEASKEQPATAKVEVKTEETLTLTQAMAKSNSSKSSKSSLADAKINSGYDLAVIAEYLKIDLKKLLSWNPGIKKKLDTRGEAVMYLPWDLMITFQSNKNSILNESLKVIRDKDQVQALN